MELKQIKNPNAMTATEMAMILAGTSYCTTKTGGGTTPGGHAYSTDCTYTTSEGKVGGMFSSGDVSTASLQKDVNDKLQGKGYINAGECKPCLP